MSAFRHITSEFWASPQMTAEDFGLAAEGGCVLVVNNRPDGEAPGQLTAENAQTAAHEAGLSYLHLPVVPGGIRDEDIDAMSSALANAPGRVLGYCASGTRSTTLWALAQVRRGAMTPDEAVRAAAAGGYDLSGLLGRLRKEVR